MSCNQSDDVFIQVENQSDTSSDHCLKPETDNKTLPRKSSLMKEGAQRHSGKKKTVSFTSVYNDEKSIACVSDCLCLMQSGSELIKVRSSGRQYKRFFLLSSDFQEISWHPSSKKPQKAKILIEHIKEIRRGRDSEVLRSLKSEYSSYSEGCFFSIVVGDSFESLDLIANSVDEANIWVTGLTYLKFKREDVGHAFDAEKPLRDKWLESVFTNADKDGKGLLEEEEVEMLMKQINSNLSSQHVQRILRETCRAKEGRSRLSSSEFVELFKKLSTRPDILCLFVRYAKKIDYMTYEELMLFLETEQGLTGLTSDILKKLIYKYEPSEEGRTRACLGIDGFTSYITSDQCSIFGPNYSRVDQNMDQPLSHYFIASSHNTSFHSNHSTNPCSVEAYVQVLKKGCRFLTVDCWDGPGADPVVHLGKMQPPVLLFRTVIEAINEFAFCSSVYPVIINLVNHCCLEQQLKLVRLMKDIFSNKLCNSEELFNSDSFSSPERLKYKIILMSKKSSCAHEGGDDDDDDDSDEENLREYLSNYVEHQVILRTQTKLCRELSDFVHLNLSSKNRHLDFLSLKDNLRIVVSLSESSALKLSNSCLEELIQYNKKYLTLVYPNTTRLDSSNYHPQDFWNCGCQMVSMNYHTHGEMMDLHEGMFLQNGSSGYVLKPNIMRDEIGSIKSDSTGFIPGISPQTLQIRIISAQNLPKPEGSSARGTTLDPYVILEVIGIPCDCVEKRTKTIHHLETAGGAMFDESFEFQLNLLDMATLRFAVLDDEYMGDEFIGQCTVPVLSMKPGYRHIPLKSVGGEVIHDCFLFVHVGIDSKKQSVRKGSLLWKIKPIEHDFKHLRPTGLRVVDDIFKSSIGVMKDANDLLTHLQISSTVLRDLCGVASVSNIKQTTKQLLSRIQSAGESVSYEVHIRNGFPILEVTGNVHEVLKRSVLAFEAFILDNMNLQLKTDEIAAKLLSCRNAAMEYHEELPRLLSLNAIKGKKLNKAIEYYAWNVRVLKGQEDLLKQARTRSVEHMKQIIETSEFLGLINRDDHPTGQTALSKSNTK